MFGSLLSVRRTNMLGVGLLLIIDPMVFSKEWRLLHMFSIVFERMVVVGRILVIFPMVVGLVVGHVHLSLLLGSFVYVFFVVN